MTNRIKSLLLLLLLTFCASLAWAQLLPISEKVTKGKLPNGLTYYIQPNSKPEKKVELRLVVNAGSLQETEAQRGFAHFTEHMLFNGTKNYPKNEIVKFLQSIGVSFGSDLNAYTSFDETVYILPIPTTDRKNLEKGFDILKDWAAYANFTSEDIDDERKVIFEESRLHKGADERFYNKILPKLFANSLYGERLPIGLDSIILKGSQEELRNFYKDWYRPDLMAVVVVGDITKEEGLALVTKYFSDLKSPNVSKEREDIVIAPFAKSQALVLTDKEATNYSLELMFSPKVTENPQTIQNYRKNIVTNIFTSILNQRFNDLKETAQPPFVNASVYMDDMTRKNEFFTLSVRPTKDINTSIKTAIEELKRIMKYGITESELEISKKRILSSIEKIYNDRNNIQSDRLADEYIRNFLKNEPIPGIEFEYNHYKDILPSITAKEVNDNAKTLLNIDQIDPFFAILMGPDTRTIKLPTDRELITLIETSLKAEVTEYVAKDVNTELVANDIKPGTITAEAYDAVLDVTSYTLSNGIKVAFKETKLKDDEIVFNGVKIGGTDKYAATDKENALFISMLIDQLGYGQFSPNDLRKALAGKNAQVNLSMNSYANKLQGKSTIADLETLFQLIHLKLSGLKNDKALFDGVVTSFSSQLAFLSANPQSAFIDTAIKVLYNNDPKTPITLPTEADLKKLDYNRITNIYQNEFANADGYNFYFSGNIDKNLFKEYAAKYLGSLTPKNNKLIITDNGLRPQNGFKEFEYRKGQDDKGLILQMYHGTVDYSEDLDLKGQLLIDVMNMKVIEEIREKMGAIYGGSFNFEMEKYPYGHYNITLGLPCGPENVQEIINNINKEISNIRTEGIEESYLNKAKLAMLESYRLNKDKNDFWTMNMEEVFMWGANKDMVVNFEQYLNKISTNDLKATANLLFGGVNSNVYQAVLLPAKK